MRTVPEIMNDLDSIPNRISIQEDDVIKKRTLADIAEADYDLLYEKTMLNAKATRGCSMAEAKSIAESDVEVYKKRMAAIMAESSFRSSMKVKEQLVNRMNADKVLLKSSTLDTGG
jgi:hypothetical protein